MRTVHAKPPPALHQDGMSIVSAIVVLQGSFRAFYEAHCIITYHDLEFYRSLEVGHFETSSPFILRGRNLPH